MQLFFSLYSAISQGMERHWPVMLIVLGFSIDENPSCRFSVENVEGQPLERSFSPAVYAQEELSELGKAFEVRRW